MKKLLLILLLALCLAQPAWAETISLEFEFINRNAGYVVVQERQHSRERKWSTDLPRGMFDGERATARLSISTGQLFIEIEITTTPPFYEPMGQFRIDANSSDASVQYIKGLINAVSVSLEKTGPGSYRATVTIEIPR